MRNRGELAAVQILADALVDAWIAALHVKKRTHDVDVEFPSLEPVAGNDIVSETQNEPRELPVVELCVA